MPPKRRGAMPPANSNRRPKLAGSARSLNVPAGTSAADGGIAPTPVVEGPKTSPVKLPVKSARESRIDPVAAGPDAVEMPETLKELYSDGPRARTQWPLVVGVGAAAVVVVVFAVLAFFKVGIQTDDVAWVDESATTEVLRVAPQALEAVFTFAPDTFDEDFDRGVQGLNQAMRDQLTEYKETQRAGVEQTQTATTAEVTEIGITRLEEDRAQLLAQMNVSSTQSGVVAGSRSGMVVVSLEKQDGNWLISEIRDR